jgi:adenine phosphoribosyltransferase
VTSLADQPAPADGSLDDLIKSHIRDVPGFPEPGISFKDITPLLADGPAFAAVVGALATGHGPIDKVAGIEARGFILAAPVALALRAGFVPVRKPGKLPGAVHEVSYDLEYGSNVLQVHEDAFRPGSRVLIVDDVLATGGTVAATAELVRRCGSQVVGVMVLMELLDLHGRERLEGLDVRTVLAL